MKRIKYLKQIHQVGRSFGVADTTVRNYIDILTQTFMIRQLQPWYENIKKRQVKSPKLYFRDSGVYHALLTVKNQRELLSHPRLGASWEGFALEQTLQCLGVEGEKSFFWSVHNQGEIDLLFHKNGKRFGVEFKFLQAPSLSKSMVFARDQLELHRVFCIYPGSKCFSLAPRIEALGLDTLSKSLLGFR